MILTHPLGLASPYPTWLKHKRSEIPHFAENIFGEKLLGDFWGYPKIRQTVFDPFPKVYDKYHVWVDDAGDYSLGKEFLTWMDERIVDERHWPIIARTGSET